MPTAPDSTVPPYTPATPTAPGTSAASFTPGSPTAPAVAVGSFSASNPTAPEAAVSYTPAAPTAPAAVVGYTPATPTAPAGTVGAYSGANPTGPAASVAPYQGITPNPPAPVQQAIPLGPIMGLTQPGIEGAISDKPGFREFLEVLSAEDVPPPIIVYHDEGWHNGQTLSLYIDGFGWYVWTGETSEGSPVFRPRADNVGGYDPMVFYAAEGVMGDPGWYFYYDLGNRFFLLSDNTAYPPTEADWEDMIGSDTLLVQTYAEGDANPPASRVGQRLYIEHTNGTYEIREALRLNPTIWSDPMSRPAAGVPPTESETDDYSVITPTGFWNRFNSWLASTAAKTVSGTVGFLGSINVTGSLVCAGSVRRTGAATLPETSDILPTAAQVYALYQPLRFTYTTAPSGWTGSNGVWTGTIPTWWNAMRILCREPGCGGASGRRGATNSACFGGGGGAGGALAIGNFIASLIPSRTLTVRVGLGGTGGAGVTTDNTDGNPGSAGGVSSVVSGSTLLIASVINQGGSAVSAVSGGAPAATNSAGNGGTAQTLNGATILFGVNGANSSISQNAGSTSVRTGQTGSAGGAAGGGISAANAVFSGGIHYAAGGTVGGGGPNGSDAQLAAASSSPTKPTVLGTGGSGSAATRNGFASGKGGDGADGEVIIYPY